MQKKVMRYHRENNTREGARNVSGGAEAVSPDSLEEEDTEGTEWRGGELAQGSSQEVWDSGLRNPGFILQAVESP